MFRFQISFGLDDISDHVFFMVIGPRKHESKAFCYHLKISVNSDRSRVWNRQMFSLLYSRRVISLQVEGFQFSFEALQYSIVHSTEYVYISAQITGKIIKRNNQFTLRKMKSSPRQERKKEKPRRCQVWWETTWWTISSKISALFGYPVLNYKLAKLV